MNGKIGLLRTMAAGCALGTLLFARGASAEVVGVIYPECCASYETAFNTFKTELSGGGFGEDRSQFYVQKPSSDPVSWANAFHKFVGADVDLIVIFGNELLEIACREKTSVPVIFGFVTNPAKARCIKSTDSPGGNVTGVSGQTSVFTLLEKSKALSDYKSIGVFDLEGGSTAATLAVIENHGNELGYRVVPLPVSRRSDLAGALDAAPPMDLLFFPDFSAGVEQLEELSKAAAGKQLPLISLRSVEGGSGALLSLYPDPGEQGRLMGRTALQLLEGAEPSKTSIVNPKKIELEVNVGLAKSLGLKVPLALLNSATKVKK